MNESQEFTFFKSPVERKLLRESTEKMVRYVHKNKIRTVVAGGSSAQPAVYLFKAIWKQKYPEEKPPAFFSLGALTRRSRLPHLYKVEGGLKGLIEKRRKKLAERLRNHESIFVLEEWVHSGRTIRHLRGAFGELGRWDVRVGCLRKKKILGVNVIGVMDTLPRFYQKRRNATYDHKSLKRMRTELRQIAGMKPIRRRL